MPKPTNKAELLQESQKSFDKLLGFIEELPEEEQVKEFVGNSLNRNIRDVLGHLYHWHMLMATWYKEGMAGNKPAMPAEGYSWKTVPELNRKIREMYVGESMEEMSIRLKKTHQKMTRLIQEQDAEALFEKKRYTWTGSTSLGAYLISATSSHYNWAYKLIRKGLK